MALLYLLVASGHDAGIMLGRAAMVIGFLAFVIGFQAFVIGVALLSIAGGGSGGEEPGSDDDGPGWRRPEPPPPPEPHVSWPDFERQFAEHVEARRTREKVPAG